MTGMGLIEHLGEDKMRRDERTRQDERSRQGLLSRNETMVCTSCLESLVDLET